MIATTKTKYSFLPAFSSKESALRESQRIGPERRAVRVVEGRDAGKSLPKPLDEDRLHVPQNKYDAGSVVIVRPRCKTRRRMENARRLQL